MRVTRIDLMRDYIIRNESASLDELCEEFQISKNTVRRDIQVLLDQGLIEKVYGGVISNKKISTGISALRPFSERNSRNNEEKVKLGRKAASFVEDNDTIFIDSGTTTVTMLPFLKEISNLTVITYSLPVIIESLQYNNMKLISLPGVLLRSTSSFTGAMTVSALKKFNINKAFMACTGIRLKNQITNATYEEYEIKKCALEQSECCYLLMDHTKAGESGMMTYGIFADIDVLITDKELEPAYKDAFKEGNTRIVF